MFNAYCRAAQEKFGQSCKAEPFHTLSFGLNYSFKYNMNGGSCTVHFMPYMNGTAVNIRYSIAQLGGARYGAHDRDITAYVVGIIQFPAEKASIDINTFLLQQNKIVPNYVPQAPVQPAQSAQPQYSPAPQPAVTADNGQQAAPKKFCMYCGAKLETSGNFCQFCGKKF